MTNQQTLDHPTAHLRTIGIRHQQPTNSSLTANAVAEIA